MKYLVLALLLVAAGCRSNPVEGTGTPEVIITTDKQAYLPEERIGLRVENKMPDPILVKECFELDRQTEDGWAFAGHGNSCQNVHHRCEVGCSMGWGLGALGPGYPAGTYRFAMEVMLQADWEQAVRMVSEPFTLKP